MWQWRLSSSRDAEWQFYSDIENEMIENAHANRKKQVELDHGIIVNLSKNTHQTCEKQLAQIRRVSRNDSDEIRARRQDRFCSAPKLAGGNDPKTNLPFGAADWNGSKFVFEWHMRCDDLASTPYGDIMRQALDGIYREGVQLGHHQESQWIVDQLMPVTKKSFKEIGQACVRLYTMEGFIYPLVNRTLRENDLSKVDTLGPFCYLLFQFNFSSDFERYRYTGRVYRGAKLTPTQVEEYERAVGSLRSWLGFTSTSRKQEIAESFFGSTVLFIIDIDPSATCAARHIADFSTYPHEDEVFLRAGQHFRIERVEPLTSQIRTKIYLTIE